MRLGNHLGTALVLAGLVAASGARAIPSCSGGFNLTGPIRPYPGYVILTTGRTTSAYITRLPSAKRDIVHERSCAPSQTLLTLGKAEVDCNAPGPSSCPPLMPFQCPPDYPEVGTDDAIELQSCRPTPNSRNKLDVTLRLYYAALAPSDPQVFFGLANTRSTVYSSWDTLAPTIDVQCVLKTVQLPLAADTYFVQVTLLQSWDRVGTPTSPKGVYKGGDTENWTLVITYNRSTRLYSAALADSHGMPHGAVTCN